MGAGWKEDATDAEGSGERGLEGKPTSKLLQLDEIAREGARRMLMAALEAEAADYVERHRDERDDRGPRTGGAQRPGASAQAYLGRGNGRAQGAAGR